ncbi:MAG: signal peptidase I [Patescibacteria group bacterium]
MNEERNELVSDTIKFALIALLIVVPIRWFVAQPFIVRGASMVPTFHNNEYLIVDQVTYRFEEPKRGDVIIMRYPKDPKTFFIKRIIGLPNETVEMQGKRIIISGGKDAKSITLDQSFIDPSRMRDEYKVYTLGSDEYFVMGDNRNESSDSRSWGNLPREDIVGRPFVRLFPPSEIGLFPGTISLQQ